MTKNAHLDLEARKDIEKGLDQAQSFTAIGVSIGKDSTTISKEVRSHLIFRKSGAYGRVFNDCAKRKTCSNYYVCEVCSVNTKSPKPCSACGKCLNQCTGYQKEECPKLLKPPYVCNGCPDRRMCTLEKHLYSAEYAQNEYQKVLSECRSGLAVSDEQLQLIDSIISPLLMQGQSLHHIFTNNKSELMVNERTLYSYVNAGLLTARNIDMPRTVRMSPRRRKPGTLKVDTECRKSRTLDDFNAYREANPDTPIVELDSVEGVKGGAVMLTITFVGTGLQLAIRRDHNDSASVSVIFEKLYWELGPDVFMELFPVCLADNGSEFSDPTKIEFDANGNRRSRVFYCDASAPYQKGSCEVRHEMIRRCIPKGVDITPYSSEQITTMMCHINSYSRKTLGNKSPYEVFAFQYGEEVLKKLGLRLIPANEIILSPKLFNL